MARFFLHWDHWEDGPDYDLPGKDMWQEIEAPDARSAVEAFVNDHSARNGEVHVIEVSDCPDQTFFLTRREYTEITAKS